MNIRMRAKLSFTRTFLGLLLILGFSTTAYAGSAIKTCADLSLTAINKKAKPFEKMIDKYSNTYDLDRNFVKAVMGVETCYRKKARSRVGAAGLMQLMPKTAKRWGVKNRLDPDQNIRGGTRYLKFLTKRFKGDKRKIAAAYNAGEGNVARYKGIPPFKETRNYVKRVMKLYNKLKTAEDSKKRHLIPMPSSFKFPLNLM